MQVLNTRVSRMRFTHGGSDYRAEGWIVQTGHGFENEVKIFDEHGKLVSEMEGPASTGLCVKLFIEGLETRKGGR